MERSSTRSTPAAQTIELRLTKLQQLFNSFDPSPFQDRDLDQDAEDYIVESADEFRLQEPLQLVIHLPTDQMPGPDSSQIENALHNYFNYRRAECQRRLRFFFRDGRNALVVGVIFLLGCTILRQLALRWGQGVVPQIMDEGLLLLGWVAMWRPLEIFLYDWRPIWHRCRLMAKVSRTPVIVRTGRD